MEYGAEAYELSCTRAQLHYLRPHLEILVSSGILACGWGSRYEASGRSRLSSEGFKGSAFKATRDSQAHLLAIPRLR